MANHCLLVIGWLSSISSGSCIQPVVVAVGDVGAGGAMDSGLRPSATSQRCLHAESAASALVVVVVAAVQSWPPA